MFFDREKRPETHLPTHLIDAALVVIQARRSSLDQLKKQGAPTEYINHKCEELAGITAKLANGKIDPKLEDYAALVFDNASETLNRLEHNALTAEERNGALRLHNFAEEILSHFEPNNKTLTSSNTIKLSRV